jgi:DNA replication initiation complex subunit (GINS family)
MRKSGLKFLSEAMFDIDQLKASCQSEEEKQLVSKLSNTIEELHSIQDRHYNRRKGEVVSKSSS